MYKSNCDKARGKKEEATCNGQSNTRIFDFGEIWHLSHSLDVAFLMQVPSVTVQSLHQVTLSALTNFISLASSL